MKTTKEKIAVMQAYEEGKTIEFRIPGNVKWNDWSVTSSPAWDWSNRDYRVKPEPEYVPYAIIDEVVKAAKEHGNFVVSKDAEYPNEVVYAISAIGRNDIWLSCGCSKFSFSSMLRDYRWADDGTPFGKLKK